MANIILATPIDTPDLTASGAAAGTVIGNVLTRSPREVWQGEDTATWLQADFGAPVKINTIAGLFSNITSAGTIRIRASDNAGTITSAPSFEIAAKTFWADPNITDPRPHGLEFFTAQTYRYWRIDFSDPGNPDGFIRLGRMVFADAFQPALNLERGWSLGFADSSRKSETDGGENHILPGHIRPLLSFTLGDVTEDEFFTNLHALNAQIGSSGEVLVVIDPDPGPHRSKKMIYGLMSRGPTVVKESFNAFKQRFSIIGEI